MPNSRLENGTFKGMVAEVGYGIVDASIAGFSRNLERYEIVDYTQGLVEVIITLMFKTPEKSDQISYFIRKSIDVKVEPIEAVVH